MNFNLIYPCRILVLCPIMFSFQVITYQLFVKSQSTALSNHISYHKQELASRFSFISEGNEQERE